MTDEKPLTARLRERFPEGLTGILALGGTRTTYILEQARGDVGRIRDFSAYGNYMLGRVLDFITMYLELGGQHMIIPLFSYQGFQERGSDYAQRMIDLCLELIRERALDFYRAHSIDPYFVGIDTLLHLPPDQPAHQLGAAFDAFHKRWPYQEGERHKLIWEVAPIPLFSFLRAPQVLGAEAHAALEAELAATADLEAMYKALYRYYARAAYGTELPIPNFYLGSNRNGDLKLRAMLPIAMVCGGPFRLYYTPYPSLFTTRETLRTIFEDLAFGKRLRSEKLDYSGQFTAELMEAEYQRIVRLSGDPNTTLGLVRQSGSSDDD